MAREALVVNNLISEEWDIPFAVSSLALRHQQQGKPRARPCGAHGALRHTVRVYSRFLFTRPSLRAMTQLQNFPSGVKTAAEVIP